MLCRTRRAPRAPAHDTHTPAKSVCVDVYVQHVQGGRPHWTHSPRVISGMQPGAPLANLASSFATTTAAQRTQSKLCRWRTAHNRHTSAHTLSRCARRLQPCNAADQTRRRTTQAASEPSLNKQAVDTAVQEAQAFLQSSSAWHALPGPVALASLFLAGQPAR